MFISDRMTRDVITVTEDATIEQAARTLADGRFHQLPVVRDGDRLVGIATDRDLRNVHGERERSGPVRRIMTARPVTVSPGEPLEEALLLLHRHRFGSLPVVTPAVPSERDELALPRLVGIITRTDILSALIDMLGIEEPGTRLEVELPEAAPGRICDAVRAATGGGARIISLVFSGRRSARRQRLYIRLSTIDPRPAIDALAEAGYRMADPYCTLL